MRWTTKISRIVSAVVLGALVTAMMSSCVFANNISPVDISVRDASFELAFCEGGAAEYILVQQRVVGADGNRVWEPVWEGSGRLVARPGDTLLLDDSVEGLVGSAVGSVEAKEGTKYAVTITFAPTHAGDPPSEFGPTFNAPSGGLEEGVWLDFSGNASSTPCD